jgi:hypothetical protein
MGAESRNDRNGQGVKSSPTDHPLAHAVRARMAAAAASGLPPRGIEEEPTLRVDKSGAEFVADGPSCEQAWYLNADRRGTSLNRKAVGDEFLVNIRRQLTGFGKYPYLQSLRPKWAFGRASANVQAPYLD